MEGGLPTEGLLAHVLISKYGDHLPLYRQSQTYARFGVELHRATLADWAGKASFHLRPVVDSLAVELKTSGKLGVNNRIKRDTIADRTGVPGSPTKGPFAPSLPAFAVLSVGSSSSPVIKHMGIAKQANSRQAW